MDETRQLVDALKRCLKMRGLTYRTLAERIGLSEASVKRIFSQRSFTLKRLEQVCGALETSVAELVRMIEKEGGRATTLSLEQEQALARDPALLSYLYLLLNGWTEPEIVRGYEFEAPQVQKLRARLVELGVIESLPRRGHRLKINRQILWRKDGPVRRAYERQVKAEFLQAEFAGPGRLLRLAASGTDRGLDRGPEAQAGTAVPGIPRDGGAGCDFVAGAAQHGFAARVPALGFLAGRRSAAQGQPPGRVGRELTIRSAPRRLPVRTVRACAGSAEPEAGTLIVGTVGALSMSMRPVRRAPLSTAMAAAKTSPRTTAPDRRLTLSSA